MAAFLAKLPFLSAEHSEKVEAWGSARYNDFRVVLKDSVDGEGHCCLAGGLFREPPRSLKHLQRLVNINLQNWGVHRRSYEHGWLRLVSRDVARKSLGLKTEAQEECAAIALDDSVLCHQCRACENDARADRRHRPEDPVEEPERKRARPEDQTLYVISLQVPGIDDCVSHFGYKIGRTGDLNSRLDDITGGLPRGPLLDLVVHASFPNAGHLERTLHKRFQDRLVDATRSREWFRVPLPEILHAIAELKER
jgi:hypothetical protein